MPAVELPVWNAATRPIIPEAFLAHLAIFTPLYERARSNAPRRHFQSAAILGGEWTVMSSKFPGVRKSSITNPRLPSAAKSHAQ